MMGRVCVVCTQQFSSLSNLKVHFEEYHDNTFKCVLCEATSKNKRNFLRHLQFHNGKRREQGKEGIKNKSLLCDKCEFSCKYLASLSQHIEGVHSDTKQYKCEFLNCDRTFPVLRYLKAHEKNLHTQKRDHACTKCPKKFITKTKLSKHISQIHTEVGDNHCPECKKNFRDKALLEEHLNAIHLKVKNHACPVCCKLFSFSANLSRHINDVHTKKKNFPCNHCDKRFSQNTSLQGHLKSNHIGERLEAVEGFRGWSGIEISQLREQKRPLIDIIEKAESMIAKDLLQRIALNPSTAKDQEKQNFEIIKNMFEKEDNEVRNVSNYFFLENKLQVFETEAAYENYDNSKTVTILDEFHTTVFENNYSQFTCKSEDETKPMVEPDTNIDDDQLHDDFTICSQRNCNEQHFDVHGNKLTKTKTIKRCIQMLRESQSVDKSLEPKIKVEDLSLQILQTKQSVDQILEPNIKLEELSSIFSIENSPATKTKNKRRKYKKNKCTECELCEKVLKTNAHLRRHINRIHGERDESPCEQCGKSFSSKEGLRSHIQYIHLRLMPKNFCCVKCSGKFSSSSALTLHIQRHHIEERSFKCTPCQKKFKTNVDLASHEKRIHSGQPHQYTCQFCIKTFFEKAKLNRHEELKHIRSGKFSCEMCEALFGNNEGLTRHMKTHLEIKDFVCPYCGKAFVQKGTLKVHTTVVHEKLKNFKCEYCEHAYGQSGDLKRHIARKHLLQ